MSERLDLQQTLDAWLGLFVELDVQGAPTSARLAELAARDVRFKDPFNDVRGYTALGRILQHTRRQVTGVRFRVTDRAWSGDSAYVKWSMTGRVAVLGDWQVEGISEIRFGVDGRVESHVDYWDAAEQFFGRLPVIGWLLRRIGAGAAAG